MSPHQKFYLVMGIVLLFLGSVATAIYYGISHVQGRDLNARAYRELTAAHWDAAIELYNQASRKKLDSATLALVYGNRGWCYTKKEMDGQAIRDFSESIRLDPRPAYSVLDRGLAYHRQGEFEKAVIDYGTALAKDPNLTDAYHNRGLIQAWKGEWALAIADFSEAIRCQPANAQFFVDRGIAYAADNQLDAAIANFDSALQYNPVHAGAYIQRAAAYARKGNSEKGLADVTKALEEMSKMPQLWFARAYIYLDRGIIAEAIADLNEALRIKPDYDPGYLLRARAHGQERVWPDLLRDTETALELNPKLSYAHYLRGRAFSAQGQFDQAIAEFNEALRADPGSLWARYYRAQNYAYRREYSRALQEMREMVERFPKVEVAHLGLAWFLATCPHDAYRNGDEAVAEAIKGCELSSWTAWYGADALGVAYAEAGDFEQAIKFANLALTLPGSSPKDRDFIEQRLALYQHGLAVRDAGGGEPSRTLFEEAVNAYAAQDYDRAIQCLNAVLPPNAGASVSAALFHFFDGTHDPKHRPPWSPEETAAMTNGFYYRGLSYERKRQWDNAIADFSTAIRREPRSRLALAERGITRNRKGEPEQALPDFEAMMRLNPDDALAPALRADTLEMTGQPDAALEAAAAAIQLDRKLALPHEVRGRAWLRKKENEKAVWEFAEAERVEPNHFQEVLASAHAFQRRREYELALAEFRETAERFPRSANPQNALAWFLATCPEARFRNGREAVTRATLACELTQGNEPDYLDTLAAAYAECGEFDQAMKFVNEAVARLTPAAEHRQEIEEHVACFQQKKPWRARR